MLNKSIYAGLAHFHWAVMAERSSAGGDSCVCNLKHNLPCIPPPSFHPIPRVRGQWGADQLSCTDQTCTEQEPDQSTSLSVLQSDLDKLTCHLLSIGISISKTGILQFFYWMFHSLPWNPKCRSIIIISCTLAAELKKNTDRQENPCLGTVQCSSEVLWKHGNDQLVTAGLFIFTDMKTWYKKHNTRMSEE